MAANRLKDTAPTKVTNKSSIVSYNPISKYPLSTASPSLIVTFSIGDMVVTLLSKPVLRETVEISLTHVSFCISFFIIRSTPNSKNSHSTPISIEKETATTIRNTGDRRKSILSCLLRSTTNDRLSAAQTIPFTVCIMVSQ